MILMPLSLDLTLLKIINLHVTFYIPSETALVKICSVLNVYIARKIELQLNILIIINNLLFAPDIFNRSQLWGFIPISSSQEISRKERNKASSLISFTIYLLHQTKTTVCSGLPLYTTNSIDRATYLLTMRILFVTCDFHGVISRSAIMYAYSSDKG